MPPPTSRSARCPKPGPARTTFRGRAARRWVLYDTAHGLATTVQHLCSQAVFARPAPHPLVSEFLDLARDSARLLPRHLTDLLGTRA
ncbi:hypothetical protein [Streptomyces sp. NBC_00212]|uniref:hypothetical protein n=1 Tax=Streptomyces sp. NBC_00212 TaxID=2975684 RepID=UPI0032539B26